MGLTRREFMARTGVGLAGALTMWRYAQAQATGAHIRLSACDWSLGAAGPAGMDVAKNLGFEGIEIQAGGAADTLQIADAAYRQQYKDAVAKTGVAISSVAMTLLNDNPMATEPRGDAWFEQTIAGTKDLNTKVILVAFFGKGDLRQRRQLKTADVDALVERLKRVAPKAKEAGVILGLEDTLSADDNLAIIDRVGSDAVGVYYDIGNSTGNLYDVPAEIRKLGSRICQFHFKDGGYYLGAGKVKMDEVAKAMNDIKYDGWVVLETATPSKDRDADFQKNAAFVRDLFKA